MISEKIVNESDIDKIFDNKFISRINISLCV